MVRPMASSEGELVGQTMLQNPPYAEAFLAVKAWKSDSVIRFLVWLRPYKYRD